MIKATTRITTTGTIHFVWSKRCVASETKPKIKSMKNSYFNIVLLLISFQTYFQVMSTDNHVGQCFSTSGSRPHLGSPSDFRGVARLPTNFLKNYIRSEKCWPNSPTYSTDVGVLIRGWVALRLQSDILGREAKKVEKHWCRPYILSSQKCLPRFSVYQP